MKTRTFVIMIAAIAALFVAFVLTAQTLPEPQRDNLIARSIVWETDSGDPIFQVTNTMTKGEKPLTFQFGLRSDGVVVWREIKKP